jgi:hypothetical protein
MFACLPPSVDILQLATSCLFACLCIHASFSLTIFVYVYMRQSAPLCWSACLRACLCVHASSQLNYICLSACVYMRQPPPPHGLSACLWMCQSDPPYVSVRLCVRSSLCVQKNLKTTNCYFIKYIEKR